MESAKHTPSWTVAAACALLLAPGTGCSFLFVQRPPERPIAADQPIDCTAAMTAPLLDAVAAVSAVAAGVALMAPYLGCKECYGGGAFGALLLYAAVPPAISSVYGFYHTSKCRNLIDSQIGCRHGNVAACQELQPKPPPPPGPPSRSPWDSFPSVNDLGSRRQATPDDVTGH